MKLYIGNYASFYKVKLFNAINRREKLIAIFTGDPKDSTRNLDFFAEVADFDYYNCVGKGRFKKIKKILKTTKYNEVIIDGWDTKENWWVIFQSPKKKNAVIVESSILESTTTGPKAFLKKIFLSRISKAYPSGISHVKLLKALGFQGIYKVTGSVGIINRIHQPDYEPRIKVENFLYVGRLVEVKNLKLLISVFNEMPNLKLTIVGFGSQEKELKLLANENIIFTGAINNRDLGAWYKTADVFVLPSISEPWGLVVEEALNNGCPILLSDKVGCSEDLLTDETGLSFKFDDKEDLKQKVLKMCEIDFYNKLRLGVSKLNFEQREKNQIEAFL